MIALSLLASVIFLGASQDSLLLRHAPILNAPIVTAFRTEARITDGQGLTVETGDLGAMKRIALPGPSQSPVLHLSYDSVRTRVRDGNGKWREFIVHGVDSAWVQITLDEQHRVQNRTSGAPLRGVTPLVDIVTGLPQMTLPRHPLVVGFEWRTETVTPLGSGTVSAGTIQPTFRTRAVLRLDSVQVRDSDTLGFLTVRGTVGPGAFVRTTGPRRIRLEVSGDVVGSFVWSTGWRAFVSGANRTRLSVFREYEQTNADQNIGELTVETTTRFQIRP